MLIQIIVVEKQIKVLRQFFTFFKSTTLIIIMKKRSLNQVKFIFKKFEEKIKNKQIIMIRSR